MLVFVEDNFTGSGLQKETSQPQNTKNLEAEVKKSRDFSKNLEIDRPSDKTK